MTPVGQGAVLAIYGRVAGTLEALAPIDANERAVDADRLGDVVSQPKRQTLGVNKQWGDRR
jgi:hypothetical protein